MAIRKIDGTVPRPTEAPGQADSEPVAPAGVLVVEDDPDLRQSLTDVLELRMPDIPVDAVADATGALRHLERHPVSCLITDLQMPGIDGLGLVVRARAAGHFMPVLLLSGVTRGPRLELAHAMLGPANVLPKPADAEALAARVAALVATHTPQSRRTQGA